MSWQGRLLAEQEADDYLISLGESARRELSGEKGEENGKTKKK